MKARNAMPISTQCHLPSGITEHVVTGSVTDDEMFECEAAFYQQGPTMLQMWDMTGSELGQITTRGMRRFIARSSRLGRARRGGRTAVIVASSVQYGLARVAEAFGALEAIPFEFRIFRQRADAVAWLESSDDGVDLHEVG